MQLFFKKKIAAIVNARLALQMFLRRLVFSESNISKGLYNEIQLKSIGSQIDIPRNMCCYCNRFTIGCATLIHFDSWLKPSASSWGKKIGFCFSAHGLLAAAASWHNFNNWAV